MLAIAAVNEKFTILAPPKTHLLQERRTKTRIDR
jgi:hypothetical protein